MKQYKFLDLAAVNSRMSDIIKNAVNRVIDSGRYIGGPEIDIFQNKIAEICGRSSCIAVSNGLDALTLILSAYQIIGRLCPGDEVIVPANSYIASALAVVNAGLTPIFADIHPASMLLDSASVFKVMTDRTRAIMPVDLYGRVWADITLLNEAQQRDILIIEDAAQAIGAFGHNGKAAGSTGNASAFSFYPTKNLGAMGDAGAIVSDDMEMIETVKSLANYGETSRYLNQYMGRNCRMDPIQAAILNAKFDFLTEENARRRVNASIYTANITNPAVICPEDEPGMIYHQYIIRLADCRDKFRAFMANNGVETAIHYPTPINSQPCMAHYAGEPTPVAARISQEIVSLPISSATSETDVHEIVEIINKFRP